MLSLGSAQHRAENKHSQRVSHVQIHWSAMETLSRSNSALHTNTILSTRQQPDVEDIADMKQGRERLLATETVFVSLKVRKPALGPLMIYK